MICRNIKRGLFVLLIGCLLLAPLKAFAQYCSDINLMPYMQKVRDQGPTATCYAFSAAYLLDYFYGEKFRPDPLFFSAFDIAIQYGFSEVGTEKMAWERLFDPHWKREQVSGLKGGDPAQALHVSELKNYCLEKKFPDSLRSTMTTFYNLAEYISIYFGFRMPDALQRARNPKSRIERQKSLELLRKGLSSAIANLEDPSKNAELEQKLIDRCVQKYILQGSLQSRISGCTAVTKTLLIQFKRFFKEMDPKIVTNAIDSIVLRVGSMESYLFSPPDASGFSWMKWTEAFRGLQFRWDMISSSIPTAALMAGMVDAMCAPRIVPRKSLVQWVGQEDKRRRSKAESFINKRLAEGWPVAVGYYVGGGLFHIKTWDGDKNNTYQHASVIVGRKRFEGRCNYLLLNTHGPDWTPPPGGAARKVISKGDPTRTLGGLFFVDSKLLLDSVTETVSLVGSGLLNGESTDGLQSSYGTGAEGSGSGGPQSY